MKIANTSSVDFLRGFERLSSLILDNNNISECTTLPPVKTLLFLSLKNNCFVDFINTASMIAASYPNLERLDLDGCFMNIPIEQQMYLIS